MSVRFVDADLLNPVIWNDSLIGLALVSEEGNWLYVNPPLADMLEYTTTELEATNFQSVTHPQDLNDAILMTKKCLNRELPGYTMSKRYLTKTGKVLWVKLKVIPIFDSNNIFKCFLSQIRPIETSRIPIPITESVKDSSFIKVLKTNWKFVVTTFLALVATSYQLYHEWHNMQEAILQLTKAVEELQKR